MFEPEGNQPPSGQQQTDADGRAGPPQDAGPGDGLGRLVVAPQPESRVGNPPAGGQELDHRQDDGAPQRVQTRDDVRQHAAGQHDRGPAAVSALSDRAGEQTQEQDGQGEAEGERVLPRQCREQIAAVDRERVVEEERQGGGRQQGGKRWAEAEEATARPGADRKQDRSEDRAHLERDVVGDDPAADRDEEVGQGEVEGVEGEPVVPAGVPAGEVPVEQQRLEVLGHRDVRARVAACGRRIGEQQARMELRERHDDDAGDRDHRDGARYPPPTAPGRRPRISRRRLGRRGLLHAHHVGSRQFRHVQRRSSRRGPRRPRHRCRPATFGLRYRPDLRSGARLLRPDGPSRADKTRFDQGVNRDRVACGLTPRRDQSTSSSSRSMVANSASILFSSASSPWDRGPVNHLRALISQ